MAAPVLTTKKFYAIEPYGGKNQIKNPIFDMPDGVEDWTTTQGTVAVSSTTQRFGAYSMKVSPATGQNSYVTYNGLSVTTGLAYTFSCYVKGTAGQAMRIYVKTHAKTFIATGYWQRVQVNFTATETATNYYAVVQRDAAASTAPFYVDGAQFEQAVKASTLIYGDAKGCGWTGLARNSTSWRDPLSTEGGLIVDLEDYCHIVQAVGLGHGDWNQILTKMTSGGDMYQTHIRKSRQFSIIVEFIGSTLGEIETNRKAVIDLLRPDAHEGQERIIRYQGVDVNGYEATYPVDIRCIPLPATLTDTPELPTYQRGVLNFTIPSGLLDGAYNEGAVLDFYADFPAEFIVKRDVNGSWCKWTGSAYASLITNLNGIVYCIAEGPDGKIYVGGKFTNAGGVTGADYLARWNTITEQWEAVIPITEDPATFVLAMAFDANGDLYIGGVFVNLGTAQANYIAKITDLDGTPTISALGTGVNGLVKVMAISPDGYVYAGGEFTLAGGVANTAKIAKWDGTTWSALATGLNNTVYALAFAPNGDLYIGGDFTNVAYPYLCKWNGTAFSVVGTNTDINGAVHALTFGATGWLYVGGAFTNAGGIANADYIARWSGSKWEALGTGTNNKVWAITVNSGKVYAAGDFTVAGGLSLTDRVAVWSNGAWQPLDIDLPGSGNVDTILPTSDGSLYIGGAFSTVAQNPDENAKCGIVSTTLSGTGVTSASANTYPIMQLTGPGTLISITNWTTGKSVAFDGLTLHAGETITLDFDPLNLQFKSSWSGRGNVMRYVVAGSDYGNFYLRPGTNNFAFYMPDNTTASYASVTWVPKFWGLDGAVL